MRRYRGQGVFVQHDQEPAALVAELTSIFRTPPKPISAAELAAIRRKFGWRVLSAALYKAIRRAVRSDKADGWTAALEGLILEGIDRVMDQNALS